MGKGIYYGIKQIEPGSICSNPQVIGRIRINTKGVIAGDRICILIIMLKVDEISSIITINSTFGRSYPDVAKVILGQHCKIIRAAISFVVYGLKMDLLRKSKMTGAYEQEDEEKLFHVRG